MLPRAVAAQSSGPSESSPSSEAARGPSRFELRLGVQAFSTFTSRIRLDSEASGRGTELRLEDDLNLEERIDVARADAVYNFNERHYVWLATYDIDRTGTRQIDRVVRFGDDTFNIAANVSAALEERIGKVSYGFNALRRPRASFGPTFGLHVMELRASLGLTDTPLVEEAQTTAPLPVIGIRGQHEFGRRWQVLGAFQWFDVEFGDVDGLFNDFIVAIEHDTFDRFGFGLAVNSNSLDVESEDSGFRGRIDLSFDSVLVYVKGSFGRASRE